MVTDWRAGHAPPAWSQRRLVDAVSFPSGQVDPRDKPYRSMTLVAPDHIASGTGRLLGRVTAAEQGAISGKYVFKPGDVVYSKIRPYLRKVIRADFAGLSSADMYPLRTRDGLDSRFLLHLRLGEHFSRFAEIVSMRSGFSKINRAEFGEYTAALPPLPEQRRIAEVLDTIDEAIRKTEEIIAKLKQVKQGLLHDLLTRGIDDNGELRDPDRHPEQFKESVLGRIPKGWEVLRLGELLAHPPKSGVSPKTTDAGVPTFSIAAVRDGRIDIHSHLKFCVTDAATAQRFRVRRGDVLLVRGNANPDLIGTVGLVRDFPDGCVYPDLLMRLTPGDEIEGEFLVESLNAPRGHGQLARKAKTTNGTLKVNGSDVTSTLVALPHRSEQNAMMTTVGAANGRLFREWNALEKLRTVKSGLMEDLLTGRVRVTALLEEAAE